MGLPKYARSLATLPVELVHRVLDDLTYIKILRLALSNNVYLNECILSHRLFRESLRGMYNMPRLNAIFRLYQDILASQFLNIAPPKYSILHQSVSYRIDLPNYILEEIRQIFRSGMPAAAGKRRLNVLSEYLSVPFTEFCDMYDSLSFTTPMPVLRRFWILVEEAGLKLKLHKSRQLKLAADLLEAYPGTLCLKKPLDPSQGPARQCTAHIVKRLRADAEKILKGGILGNRYSSQWVYRMNNLPLVPYDRYLVLLLKTKKGDPLPPAPLTSTHPDALHTNPPSNSVQSSRDDGQYTPTEWPPELLADYETVMDGISYIYMRPLYPGHKLERNPRKRAHIEPHFLEFGEELAGWKYPAMFITAPRSKREINDYGFPAHDDREYKWLQAFLRVVTRLEGGHQKEEGNQESMPPNTVTSLPS